MSSDYKQLIKEMAEYITLNSTSVKLSGAGVLSINGERIQAKDFSGWMVSFSKSEETKKFYSILLDAPSPTTALEMLKVEIKSFQKLNKVPTGTDVKTFTYDTLIPFISIKNSNTIVFFDKKTNTIKMDLDYASYKVAIDPQFQLKPLPCVIEFNPYRPEQKYLDEYLGQTFTHINTYIKPEWQLGRQLTTEETKEYSKLPPIIDEFFTHLFPDPTCKEFVYDWLHYALNARNETYLVMNGAKGVGKNVLSNTLCSSLVGKQNHKIAHKGALEQFNSILADCRMIVFDEFKIADDESINALKRYANSEQMIHYKGLDVGKTQKTYNSFIICNNSLNDMRIEWDDRRFSVVDLTTVKLEDVWSSAKIKLFFDIIEDPTSEEMVGFGYWLLYRTPKVMEGPFSVWKGDHFYKLCYTSFPEWAKMIIDEITSGNPKPYYDEAELKMMLKERTNNMNRFPQRSKVEDFLKNYKHRGQNYLGHIELDERTYYLQVNEHFIKKMPKDSTGHNWLSLTSEDNLL